MGTPETPQVATPDEPAPRLGLVGRIKAFIKRNHAWFWWLHSIYALGLGVLIMFFAAKGFEQSRILAATLGGAFILILVIFRIFGQGKEQLTKTATRGKKVQFVVMSYVLKNLYQGMLFFVLPFYWKSSSLDSMNGWFVVVLAVLAVLATMDMIFDNILMRYRVLAATYFGVTLFACVNLVIPALLPEVRTIVTLLTSAALAVAGFSLLHYRLARYRTRGGWIALGVTMVCAMTLVYVGRSAIPPVPAYVSHAAVGPKALDDGRSSLLSDGRLSLELARVHKTLINDLHCVSDVALPAGKGDQLTHVWRFDGADFEAVSRETTVIPTDQPNIIRLSSSLSNEELPADYVGEWTVDVITADDQIVGRARFAVIE